MSAFLCSEKMLALKDLITSGFFLVVSFFKIGRRNEQSRPDGANASGFNPGTTSADGSYYGSITAATGAGETSGLVMSDIVVV